MDAVEHLQSRMGFVVKKTNNDDDGDEIFHINYRT